MNKHVAYVYTNTHTHTQLGRQMSTNDNAKWANMLTIGD